MDYILTINCKLKKPTKAKRELLDAAFERYSNGVALLLERLKPILPFGAKRTQALKAIDKGMMHELNAFSAQPFKDAIKLDVAMLMAAYYGRRKAGLSARYPHPSERSILFCRYSDTRDYCLLKDPDTGRYYAKLYLLSRENAASADAAGARLTQLSGEAEADSRSARRYVLFPLDLGDWQRSHLADVEVSRARAMSAVLKRAGSGYELCMRLKYAVETLTEPNVTLGVARGRGDSLCYVAVNPLGEEVRVGRIEPGDLHIMANRAAGIAKELKAQVVVATLRMGSDGLRGGEFMRRSQYAKLSRLLEYKLMRRGLPPPIAVSARGLFLTCPVCQTLRKGNRLDERVLLCVNCGQTVEVESAGALNLAHKVLRYAHQSVRVNYSVRAAEIRFDCPQLEFVYESAADTYATLRFENALKERLKDGFDTRLKRSLQKKLLGSENLREMMDYREV